MKSIKTIFGFKPEEKKEGKVEKIGYSLYNPIELDELVTETFTIVPPTFTVPVNNPLL